MNIINCSLNCIYQQDGLCGRGAKPDDILSKSPECAFYKDKQTSDEKEL